MPLLPPDTEAPDETEKTMKLLLEATEAGNYTAFLAPGTERFQKGISKAMFDGVSKQVASRLKAGHAREFLGEIKQCGHRVFLWKVSFSDGGDEYIARLTLTAEGKVAGVLLN